MQCLKCKEKAYSNNALKHFEFCVNAVQISVM